MISKEALETIRSIDGSVSVEQTINECCDIIEEDLEVLEILKKGNFQIGKTQVIFFGNYIESDVLVLKNSINLSKEEKKLIEEWLDNEI